MIFKLAIERKDGFCGIEKRADTSCLGGLGRTLTKQMAVSVFKKEVLVVNQKFLP